MPFFKYKSREGIIMVEKYLMYLRKSRADSDAETVADVLQRHEAILQEFAVKKFGTKIPEENIFREVVSGETIEKRPEMKKILSLVANSDKYAGMIVVEPQRLSRGDMLDCGTIVRVLRYNNIKVLTPTVTFDLSEDHERKYFEMTLTQGNDYLEYIKTILSRGRLSSVKEGCYLGSKPPFGYDRTVIDGKHTLKPNNDADTVKVIFDLFVNHDTGSHLIGLELEKRGMKPLNVEHWHPATIRNILRNPVYAGKIRWNNKKVKKITDENGNTYEKRDCKSPDKMVVDGLHQAIVSEELFNKAQDKFGKIAKTPVDNEVKNPFATLMKCGRCGRAILLRQPTRPNDKSRLQCANQTHCHSASTIYEPIKYAVIKSLMAYIDDFEIKLENNEGNSYKLQEKILENLNKKQKELSEQQNKLYELLEKGIYSEALFLERQEKLNNERKLLDEAIKNQKENMPAAVDYENKIYSLKQALEMIQDDSISAKQKNQFLKNIIDRIEITTPLSQKEHRINMDDVSVTVYLK